MKKRIVAIGFAILITGLLFTGCDYDPSLYEYVGEANSEGMEVILTGTVMDKAVILSEPSEGSDVVATLEEGEVVTITGEGENGFYPVEYNGTISGYVSAEFLDVQETLVEVSDASDESAGTVITATVIDNINIRRGPGQDYELIERIGPGVVLTIIGEEENGYYPVDYNGEVGYAHHNFIEINEQPEVVQTEAPIAGPITVDNNESFAEVLSISNENDERIGQFFGSHIGDEIEFDGYIADMAYHGSWNTRFDLLVFVGDCGSSGGPLFHYTDVSFTYDMHFDNNTPDMVGVNDEFRFTAVIVSFNDQTGLVELEPVSTVYRGD